LPGTYIVGVEPPSGSNFSSALDSNVAVNRGAETTHNVTLSAFRGDVFILGASSMLGWSLLRARPTARHHHEVRAQRAARPHGDHDIGLAVARAHRQHAARRMARRQIDIGEEREPRDHRRAELCVDAHRGEQLRAALERDHVRLIHAL